MKFVAVLLFTSVAVAVPGKYHGDRRCPDPPIRKVPGPTMRCAPPDCRAVLCMAPKEYTVPCRCPLEKVVEGCEQNCCFPKFFKHSEFCPKPMPKPAGTH